MPIKTGVDFKLPADIWIAGKGPSLDRFNWSKAGPCRIGINETCLLIPNVYAGFATDYPVLERLHKELPARVLMFRKRAHIHYEFPLMQLWDFDECGITTIVATSTPVAVQVFYHFGARNFHMIGFDAVDRTSSMYADMVLGIGAEGDTHDGYRKISMQLLLAFEEHADMNVTWEHKNV